MKPETISPGMRGFIVTCFRNQESRCISELYDFFNKVNLLNHFHASFTSNLGQRKSEPSRERNRMFFCRCNRFRIGFKDRNSRN